METVYNTTCNEVDIKYKMHEVDKKMQLCVKKQTNGLIGEVFHYDAFDKYTWLIFATAIYFKGEWTEKFERSKTKNYDFHLLDGNKVRVPIMTSFKDQFLCVFDDFKNTREISSSLLPKEGLQNLSPDPNLFISSAVNKQSNKRVNHTGNSSSLQEVP
ncbi:hypothetical protein L1987_18460 [Smallanthus sonchifolius]|uniref:Uncharacterized protein n=1 Tax=Smallanthus sonchifolius TaxID=185202 RepID=A0ACB9IZN3_9ASTR|nr:hypothetical protein L1987_18460 [Smallanthus sonchifolius]